MFLELLLPGEIAVVVTGNHNLLFRWEGVTCRPMPEILFQGSMECVCRYVNMSKCALAPMGSFWRTYWIVAQKW